MGRQVGFYLSLTDMSELEKELTSVEPTIILHERSRGPFPRVVDATDFVEDGRRQYFFYFARATDLDFVITKEVKTQGYWSIEGYFSPVVEVISSGFDGKLLRPGRLYYNDVYYNEKGTLIRKNEGFNNWAKKLLSKTRRLLDYDKELCAYVGAGAREMRKEGVKFAG